MSHERYNKMEKNLLSCQNFVIGELNSINVIRPITWAANGKDFCSPTIFYPIKNWLPIYRKLVLKVLIKLF